MIKIIADSSCDILTYSSVDFAAVPLTISTEERAYIDDKNLDCHEMLDYLASYKSRSYTACPSTESWLSAFEGADEIYIITMTSNLSGTWNSACLAAELYKKENPNAKIAIFDTLSTGPEMHLIVEKVISLVQAGKSMTSIQEEIPAYIQSTRLFFSFTSLHNFAQNGRVNKAVASAIGVLGIRVLGTASEDGNIAPTGKCRGDKKAVHQLFEDMKSAGYHGGQVRICQIENEPLATQFADTIHADYPDADVQVYPARGICSYYGERGGIIIGCECS